MKKRTLIPTTDVDDGDGERGVTVGGAVGEVLSEPSGRLRRRSVAAAAVAVTTTLTTSGESVGPLHDDDRDEGDFEDEDGTPPPTPLHLRGDRDRRPLSPAVYMFAACAAWNSCILGYDFGVNALSAPLVQKTLDLSDLQISAYLGSLEGFAMLGAATASFVSDRFGRRGPFVATSFGFLVGDLTQAGARTFAQLMAGRSMLGLAIGWGLAIDPMYISEISPASRRGFLVSWSEIAINVGIIFGFASGIVFHGIPDERAWRYMYASGAILPLTMFVLVRFCMPESPRWLLQKDREDDARRVLATLNAGDEEAAEASAREIKERIRREEDAFRFGWGFLLCRPTPAYRRMLLAGVVSGVSQQVVGISAIGSFQAFVLDRSGVHDRYRQSLTLLCIQTMKSLVTFGSSRLIDSWGRRRLAFVSIAGIVVSLLVLAADFHLSSGATSGMAIVGLLGYMASFAMGMGPVAWLVPSEVFTTSIRAKGTSLATFCNRAVSTMMSSSFLELQKAITWSGAFLVLAVLSIIMAVLINVFVPETTGRSLEDMAVFFASLTGDKSVLDHLEEENASALDASCDGSNQTKETSSSTTADISSKDSII